MQFLKRIGLAAIAGAALLAATATSSFAEDRKAGSFEFFINAAGGLSYMEIDSLQDGDVSFGGALTLGFDIATNNDGFALGVEGGYEYLGLMDFGTPLDFEVGGFPIGVRLAIPVGTTGATRFVGSTGSIFWQTEITGYAAFCGPSGCGAAFFDQTERGTGYYLRAGFEFDITGPLHAGVDLRYFQLAEDAMLFSPQFRLGLHF